MTSPGLKPRPLNPESSAQSHCISHFPNNGCLQNLTTFQVSYMNCITLPWPINWPVEHFVSSLTMMKVWGWGNGGELWKPVSNFGLIRVRGRWNTGEIISGFSTWISLLFSISFLSATCLRGILEDNKKPRCPDTSIVCSLSQFADTWGLKVREVSNSPGKLKHKNVLATF